MDLQLEGHRAIVTGSSAGIGTKAYRRMPGARRDTALAAAMPEALAAQITQAEQATPRPAIPPGTSHDTLGRHRVADARDRRQRKSGDEREFVVDQSPARSW